MCITSQVPLDKEGPVHEAAWSPSNEEFVVVYGFMPAKATIFSASKCEPKYQLGAGPHNTVRWNPFGRFICLAGFGNLPGDMKFFDRKADGKYKLVGETRAACSVRDIPCPGLKSFDSLILVYYFSSSTFLRRVYSVTRSFLSFPLLSYRLQQNGPQMGADFLLPPRHPA